MQQPVSATPPPEPENKCLAVVCLFMKLEAIPSQSEQPLQSTATAQVNLHLTIQFNEQWEQLLEGHIKFGLKAGKLRVRLKNGKISLSSMLSGSHKLVSQQQRQGEGELEGKASLSTQKTTARTDNIHFTSCQITTKGSEESPVLVFGVESSEAVLKGLLKNVLLASISVRAKPCYVEATFYVSPQDVYMTEAEGLWQQNISKKRKLVIERAIVRHFFKRKLMPYLSRQELRYD